MRLMRGMTAPAMMPMTTTTISISMAVKPLRQLRRCAFS
jgi:hypothetical protein